MRPWVPPSPLERQKKRDRQPNRLGQLYRKGFPEYTKGDKWMRTNY